MVGVADPRSHISHMSEICAGLRHIATGRVSLPQDEWHRLRVRLRLRVGVGVSVRDRLRVRVRDRVRLRSKNKYIKN